jgi:hypothetical protein
MLLHRPDLELALERAWLAVLRDECAVRRQRLIEALDKAKATGDLAACRRLISEWRRFPNVYGEGPPPV